MTLEKRGLPPLQTMQSSLQRITEALAAELAFPTQAAPDWSELEWRLAPAVAAMHGISALLASTLRWQGPPAWNDFLAEQRYHVQRRQRRCEELLKRID